MRIERVRHRCLLVMYLFTAGIIVCGKSSAGADKQSPPRTSTFEFKFLDGNQINCTINSSGPFADYLRTGQGGLEWPKGSGKTAVFTSGIWLIGRHAPSGQLRTAVQDYHTEYLLPAM